MSKRIVFAGTPEFARIVLEELLAGPEVLVGVLTQPDRPAGRGRHLQESPVKQLAREAGIPVFQPESCKTPEALDLLRSLQPDLLIVVAYGQILPQAVLDTPRLGAINVHASLLPAWRGPPPLPAPLLPETRKAGWPLCKWKQGWIPDRC